MFNATEPVEDIKLNLMVATVQTEAPTLWGFLTSLIRQRGYNAPREDLQSYSGNLFMICAILTSARAPQKVPSFRRLWQFIYIILDSSGEKLGFLMAWELQCHICS